MEPLEDRILLSLAGTAPAPIFSAQSIGTSINHIPIASITYQAGYASVAEPPCNPIPYYFTVSLDSVPSLDTTVYYRTQDGAAQAGIDYLGLNYFKVLFHAGSTGAALAQTIAVQVKPDPFVGRNPETFYVHLVGAYNATIDPAKNTATGTIDQITKPLPVIANISDFIQAGPASGSTVFNVPITLTNGPADLPVSVYYRLTDGTAKTGVNYAGVNNGHVTIPAGQLTNIIDAANKTTTYAYDAIGELTTVTDPLNHTTTIAYDADGRITKVTDALSHSKTYAYDAAGDLMVVTDASSNATTMSYGAAGRLITATDALGTTTHRYDNDRRRQMLCHQRAEPRR